MQKRAIRTRGRILNAARSLFSMRGFHGTSVDRIAEKARANKQRIYQYFGSKSELFTACLKASFEDVGTEDEALLEKIGGDCTRMTEVIIRHYMHLHRKHPDFWRLVCWANLESGPFYKCLKNIKDGIFSTLGSLYLDGQKTGVFAREVSFETYMFCLFSLTYFYHSNSRTLSNTLDAGLFTPGGEEKLIGECITLISNKGWSGRNG